MLDAFFIDYWRARMGPFWWRVYLWSMPMAAVGLIVVIGSL